MTSLLSDAARAGQALILEIAVRWHARQALHHQERLRHARDRASVLLAQTSHRDAH